MSKYDKYKRICAEIDLDAFVNNFENITNAVKDDTKVIAVLKTDGYGHGAIPLARAIENHPKLFGYALATAEEALLLRKAGLNKPMLILGYTFEDAYEDMIKNDITFAVFREDMLESISETVKRISKDGKQYKAKVHIKMDTGMGRIGIRPDDEGISFVKKALSYDEIYVEGIFTHCSKADESDRSYTYLQLERFSGFVDRIKNELSYDIPFKHLSNSAGIIEYNEANFDIARAGIILYGLWPSDEVSKDKVSLKPILSLYSSVVYIKEIHEGDMVSYGGTFKAPGDMRIATISAGYGDGYPRGLSNKGEVIIRGVRCPIIGRVCMDQFMVDVTKVEDVMLGDTVTLIGTDGNETITAEEVGDISGRFNYELTCDLGKRIPRVYVRAGQVVSTKDYYDDIN